MVEGMGDDALALRDERHHLVLQVLARSLLLMVADITVVPHRIDEPAVVGPGAGTTDLVAEVTLSEAEHAMVGGRRSGLGECLGVGPAGAHLTRHRVAEVNRLRIAVGQRPELRDTAGLQGDLVDTDGCARRTQAKELDARLEFDGRGLEGRGSGGEVEGDGRALLTLDDQLAGTGGAKANGQHAFLWSLLAEEWDTSFAIHGEVE